MRPSGERFQRSVLGAGHGCTHTHQVSLGNRFLFLLRRGAWAGGREGILGLPPKGAWASFQAGSWVRGLPAPLACRDTPVLAPVSRTPRAPGIGVEEAAAEGRAQPTGLTLAMKRAAAFSRNSSRVMGVLGRRATSARSMASARLSGPRREPASR